MTPAERVEELIEVGIDDLRAFAGEVYEHVGVPADDAAVIVDAQLDADLRGVDTHGLQRLPWYVGYIERGENNAAPQMRTVRESPVHVLLDADRAIGQLACVRLMEATLQKAEISGLAVGATVNSNDWGCGAYYPLLAARRGFVAFATEPIVLDMALTPVALGKVLRAMAEGTPIPLDWGFRDRDGSPTADPATALGGIIPAISDYKGTGLAMMMNVLAGVLPGGFHSGDVAPGRRGQLFLLMSPELFQERAGFDGRVEEMVAQIEAAEVLPGAEVMLPGAPEQQRAAAARARRTVRYPPSVVAGLGEMVQKLGIDMPVGTPVPAG